VVNTKLKDLEEKLAKKVIKKALDLVDKQIAGSLFFTNVFALPEG